MPHRMRHEWILVMISTFTTASAAEAQGCFVIEGESRTISVSAAGVQVDVSIFRYADDAFEEGAPTCHASTSVRLSSFPTSRLALRPREIAEAIRDAADELDAKECAVVVFYENDTGEDFEDHELCATEVFRYDGDSYWSSSPEQSCWDAAQAA